jgi:hypothetical protein
VFLFPLIHLRFIEMTPGALAESADVERAALPPGLPVPMDEPEADLEIDEEFLRRVRDA